MEEGLLKAQGSHESAQRELEETRRRLHAVDLEKESAQVDTARAKKELQEGQEQWAREQAEENERHADAQRALEQRHAEELKRITGMEQTVRERVKAVMEFFTARFPTIASRLQNLKWIDVFARAQRASLEPLFDPVSQQPLGSSWPCNARLATSIPQEALAGKTPGLP